MADARTLTMLQLIALVKDVATILASYRTQLEAAGMEPGEAWALTRELERRLLGPAFDEAEAPPALAALPCPECAGDQVLDVSGTDGRAWLCLDVACLHHWRAPASIR